MAETVPCVPLPKQEVIRIPLPYGAELRSIIDIAQPPSQCTVVHSLMLQIMPLLASMECIFKMLAVLKALEDTVKSGFLKTGDLLSSIADLSGCFLLFDVCEVSKMIAAILKILISWISCMVEAVESVLDFQAGIDLDSAQGNPVLLASLNCAQDNAQTSLTNLSTALEGIQPLLDIVGRLGDLVGLPPLEMPPLEASTPKLGEVLDGEDPLEPVKTLRDALQSAHDALPCK